MAAGAELWKADQVSPTAVRVLANRMLEDGTVLIEVESTLQTTQCHRCGRMTDRFHGFDRPIRLRHLPVFGRRVVVEIRPKRYRCPGCEGGPTTTQRAPGTTPTAPIPRRSSRTS